MRHILLRAISGAVVGVSAWFSLGALAITDGRVIAGLLPPAWLLAILAIAGLVFALLVRTVSTPLLWLPALSIVPWFSARVPGLVLWSGPFVVVMWALFVAGVISSNEWRPIKATSSRWMVASVAAIAIVAFAAGSLRRGITGDEPHYLLVAQSVLLDSDLDLANDYDPARHRAFYAGPLEPRHTVLVPSGKEYSFHGIGVAALALPGFAAAGLAGAQALFALFALATIVALWTAVRDLTRDSRAAWAAACALLLNLPFLAQSVAIYPEIPAAAITSFAMLTLLRLERRGIVSQQQLIACAASLSILPWLHLRLTVIAIVFGVAIALAMRRQRRAIGDVVAFFAVPIIAAALFFATTYVMFETLDPTEVFRGRAAGSIAAVPTGAFGLLFDLEYGLLVYAPIMTVAVLGWTALRAEAPLTACAGASAAIGTLLVGAAFVWWGGTSSPARFLVAVLPLLALCIGAWWPVASSRARAVALGLMAYSAAIAAFAATADGGRYVTNDADGRLSIFEWANRVVDFPSAVPSLFRAGTTVSRELVIAVLWLASGVAILRFVRRLPAAWTVIIWITAAASVAWLARGVDPLSPNRGQLAVLQASSSSFFSTPWLDRRPSGSVDDVLPSLTLPADLSSPPAGRYRVEVVHRGAVPDADTTLAVHIGGGDHALFRWPLNEIAEASPIALPVPVESLRVVSSSKIPEGMDVRLRPIAGRWRGQPQGLRAQYAVRSGDALLFVFDTPQREDGGFWVMADRPVAVLCARPDGVSGCAAFQFEATAHGVNIRLRQGEWTRSLSLAPREKALSDIPSELAPVTIEASGPASRTPAVFVTAADAPQRGVR